MDGIMADVGYVVIYPATPTERPRVDQNQKTERFCRPSDYLHDGATDVKIDYIDAGYIDGAIR